MVALACWPAAAHDIYMGLRSPDGFACCDKSDCRPAYHRVSGASVQMFVEGVWITVPRHKILYHSLAGDGGRTGGGHWCGARDDKGRWWTYCAILPPKVSFR